MAEQEDKGIMLLESATSVFMRLGIKSVNMDDMARHLGISKKTLYLYVKDKEDLVSRAIGLFIQREREYQEKILKMNCDAIEENLEIMKWVSNILQNIHPSVLFDLQKYHPKVGRRLQQEQESTILQSIELNLKKGQREGLFRKDFNPTIIAKIYAARIGHMFYKDSTALEQLKLSELHSEIFKYHIHGVASPKGLERLKEKMKSFKLQ